MYFLPLHVNYATFYVIIYELERDTRIDSGESRGFRRPRYEHLYSLSFSLLLFCPQYRLSFPNDNNTENSTYGIFGRWKRVESELAPTRGRFVAVPVLELRSVRPFS